MKMKKIGVTLGLFLLASASIVYAYNSSEAQKFFTQTCPNTKLKGIEAAVCDLYQRVVALEARPTWDETRIATLEARVTALENSTTTPPVSCTAVLCENFNSYSNGQLVGQGGWIDRASGSFYVIQDTVVKEGAKALSNFNSGSDSVVTKVGNSFTDGRQAVYIRTADRANWGNYNIGENVQVRISKGSWDSTAFIVFALKKDGHASYYDPGVDKFVDFDTYSDNAWTLAEIEWRSSDKTARYRVNSGTWTSWIPMRGAASFTDFDTVGFGSIMLGSGGVYFDDLQ